MAEQRMAKAWAGYRAAVVPSGAGPEQLQGTELAFYGGASALFGIIMAALEPGADPTEGDLRVMDELYQELRQHAQAAAKSAPASSAIPKGYGDLQAIDKSPDATLAAWGPEAGGPLTQVHLILKLQVPHGELTNVVRFKSAIGVDRFVEHLQALRKQVWP